MGLKYVPTLWEEEFARAVSVSTRANTKLPKRYILNENAAILFWDDLGNNKTIVKRTKKDKPDARIAFLTAYFQKHSGLSKNKANRYLDNLKFIEK